MDVLSTAWETLGKEKSGPPFADFPERLAVQGERRSRVRALGCEGLEPRQRCKWTRLFPVLHIPVGAEQSLAATAWSAGLGG